MSSAPENKTDRFLLWGAVAVSAALAVAFFFYSSSPPAKRATVPSPSPAPQALAPAPAPAPIQLVRHPQKTLAGLKGRKDGHVPPPNVAAAKENLAELSFEQMKARWDRETEDSDLTENLVSYFGNVFQLEEGGMAAFHQVQCRQTICRFELDPQQVKNGATLAQILVEDGFGMVGSTSEVPGAPPIVTGFIFARSAP